MSATKKIRLTCDIKNPSRIIDEYTDAAPVVIRGEPILFELGLMQNGRMVTDADINYVGFRIAAPDEGATLLADSTNTLNSTFTGAQWRNGSASLATIEFSGADTATLVVGNCGIQITGNDTTGPYTESSYLSALLMVADASPAIAFTPPGTPSDFYDKTASDARYAFSADLTDVDDRVTTLEGVAPVLFTAQTKTAPQKAQARTNIGAAAATSTLDGFTSDAMVFSDYQAWSDTLSTDKTLTATGTPGAGIPYIVNLIQDVTGGRNITWPSGFVVSNGAILNPKPATTTAFVIRSKRVASGAFTSLVEPIQNVDMGSEPAWRFDLRQYNRVAQSSGITSATDPLSGLVTTYNTARASYVASGISLRPAAGCTAAGGYTFGATGTAAPIDATIPAGLTIAVVFDSRSATDARLVHLGPLGLSIDQRGGNLEFGSQSTTANRVAVPFAPNDSLATLAIFTFHVGGGASAVLIKNGSAAKVAYAAGAVAGTTTTEWHLFQAQALTSRWTGRCAHVSLYDRCLTWEQTQALAATLCADFGIN